MACRTAYLGAVALVLAIHVGPGWVQAADDGLAPTRATDEQPTETLLSPDSQVSRDDWKRRIEDARKRSEQARAEWRRNAPSHVPAPDPPEKVATERVLNDDTLQPGDIVSTDKGLFLFRGRSGPDGQAADLVPINQR